MASRYELTISTKYVPDWTYIDAFRELFQNAIDNEQVNPQNKMCFKYNGDTITISNKTSKLDVSSLLLGSTTKADSKNTIGQHGEGYKIAFMVLLRIGKGIKVYNYGNREVWDVKLVKSRRFSGELVPVVIVNKEYFWKSVPDNDLTIEVSNISSDEYESIKLKNLHLRNDIKYLGESIYGKIIANTEEKGNIYVKGLYVCNLADFKYGYSFEPEYIKLDRDRKLVSDFNASWNTSKIWSEVVNKDTTKESLLEYLLENTYKDIEYIKSVEVSSNIDLGKRMLILFKNRYGTESIPVINNSEMELARKAGYKPIIVGKAYYNLITAVNDINISNSNILTIKDRLQYFLNKIEYKLNDTELKELQNIIKDINN